MKAEDIPPDGYYWVLTTEGGGWDVCSVDTLAGAQEVTLCGDEVPYDPEDVIEFGPRLEPPTDKWGPGTCGECGRLPCSEACPTQ